MTCEIRKEGDKASIVCARPTLDEHYRCAECGAEHGTFEDARKCGCPRSVYSYYICPYCKKEYGTLTEAQDCAFACFMLQPQPVPICEECDAGIHDAKDIDDSAIIGSILRCRACIKRVAPELEAA